MPNRILKESICSSESVDKLSWFEEVFFCRLIVNADDHGRMDARPAILRARLFPLRDVTTEQIAEALAALQAVGCIGLYEVDGAPYLQFPDWDKHQTIRAKRSKFPAPPSASKCMQMQADASKCSRNPIQSESESESESNPNPPDGDAGDEELFDKFWNLYPKRRKRQDAHNAWRQLQPDEALATRIIAAVEAHRCSESWMQESGRYIPMPDRYLRERRWEDELPPPHGMIAATLDTKAMDEALLRFTPRL